MPKLQKIILQGTNFEIGCAFGEQFRQQIKLFSQQRWDSLNIFISKYGKTTISWQQVMSLLPELLQMHADFDDNCWQEFCGIAKGANIDAKELLLMMSYTDIRDYICHKLGNNDLEVGYDMDGCSSFLLPQFMSTNNNVIVGQTWDMSTTALDHLVVIHRKPINQAETLCLTTAGCLSLLGINSHGLAMGTTNLMCKDSRIGVNYLFLIHKSLNCNNINQAKNVILQSNRLSGHSYFITDGQQAIDIETTATLNHVRELCHFPLIHTNHILNDELRHNELNIPRIKYINSNYRYGMMLSNFTAKRKFSPEECWQILANNKRSEWGGTICNEDYVGHYGNFSTVATSLMCAHERSLWLCEKGAANSEKNIFYLD